MAFLQSSNRISYSGKIPILGVSSEGNKQSRVDLIRGFINKQSARSGGYQVKL